MTSETIIGIFGLVGAGLMAIMTAYVSLLRYAFARAEADLKAADERHEKQIEAMRAKHENETNECAVEIKGLQNRLRENDLATEALKGRCNTADVVVARLQQDIARLTYRSDPKQPASGGRG